MIYGALLPPSMADDEPAIRACLIHSAAKQGHTVAPDAPITSRILTYNFDPDLRMLFAEVEVTE